MEGSDLFKQYEEYFEAAAESNKILRHNDAEGRVAFKSVDIEEIISAAKVDFEDVFLCLESPTATLADFLSDNVRLNFNSAFSVLAKADMKDFASRRAALNLGLKVSLQIIAKIKNDMLRASLNKNHKNTLGDFQFPSVIMNKVGPVFSSWYGYRVEFTFSSGYPDGGQLVNEEWSNDENFKTDF